MWFFVRFRHFLVLFLKTKQKAKEIKLMKLKSMVTKKVLSIMGRHCLIWVEVCNMDWKIDL